MFLMWIANNIPTTVDVEWFKRGGGMFGGKEPPAYKFNGGQKLIFWIVVLGGGAVIATGYMLMFPFYGTTIAGMELAQIVHGIVGGAVRRRHARPHLYRHDRHGRRLRGDGRRQRRRQLGQGAP